jgi:ubiquinone/menaquinone biosynthesis C-methylase UbiE
MSDLSPFWDKLADRYAAKPIADQTAYRTKLARTQEFLRPDMELLEFGCGTGGTAIAHAPHVRHIRAIDFSENMLAHGRRAAAQAGIDNISFERVDIATIPLAPESLDIVLGLSVLHLLPDRDAIIGKVYAALKPGGLFISSTACLGDSMRFFSFIAPIGRWLGKLPYLDIMSRAELVASMTHAGFAIEHDWQPSLMAAVFLIARKPAVDRTTL